MAFHRKNPAVIGAKAPLPGFIEPALASSIEKVPTGDRWVHEIKFDGYRVQVHLANNEVSQPHTHSPIWSRMTQRRPREGQITAGECWLLGRG